MESSFFRTQNEFLIITQIFSQNEGWFKNAAGFLFNPAFGFGLMNGEALVMAGSNWTTVPEKTTCKVVNMYK